MVLICLKLNPFHPRELWMKLAKWFWSKRLLNSVLSSLRNLESSPYPRMFEPSLIEIDPLHLQKKLLKIWSIWLLLLEIKKWILLKFAQCLWKKKFFLDNCVYEFSQFCHYLLLKKSVVVHFNKLKFPLAKGCFVSNLVETVSVAWNHKQNDV